MQTVLWLIFAALAACIVAMHVLSVSFSDKRGTLVNLINIALHIVFLLLMLYMGTALELVALAFMLSLLVYVLAFEIKRRKKGRGEDK